MVEKLQITGGRRLAGEVSVGGAKNAAVATIPAVILCDEPCLIENLPYIDDVRVLNAILTKMGAETDLQKNGSMRIDPRSISTHEGTIDLVRRLRASYYLLGALLGRFNKAEIFLPGGCAIGIRPIDLHIKGMEALGANIITEYGKLIAEAPNGLHGADIYLDTVSVGATINIMLAAVKAQGITTLVNAAKEPHVVDLANFLNA